MTFYQINGKKLTPIKFDRESKLQKLTQDNLDELFNLEFIGEEVQYGDFRMDTLAFDRETNSFVIIEYKNVSSYSVIDQGFSYLSILLNDKDFFMRKYNEISDCPLDLEDFDFTHCRVMIIAPSFTKYQMKSTEFSNLPIELWKVRLYENGCVSYDKIRNDSAASIKDLLETRNLKIDLQDLEFGEDDLLCDKSQECNELYYNLKDRLLFEFDDLSLNIFKTLASYKVNDNIICTVEFLSKSLKVMFFTKTLDDPENRTEHVERGNPNVNYSMKLSSQDEFDNFIELFTQVYREKLLL